MVWEGFGVGSRDALQARVRKQGETRDRSSQDLGWRRGDMDGEGSWKGLEGSGVAMRHAFCRREWVNEAKPGTC